MKYFLILSTLFFVSNSASGIVLRPQRIIIDRDSNKKLGGYGVTFNSSVVAKESKEKTDNRLNAQDEKKKLSYFTWIRGCGEIEIKTKDGVNLSNGDKIKVRLSGPKSCVVADWEKY